MSKHRESSLFRQSEYGIIHVVVRGGGSHISHFGLLQTTCSIYRDSDYDFVKPITFKKSFLLFEYKRSSDRNV